MRQPGRAFRSSGAQVLHRDPRDWLAALRAIEVELLEEIDALDAMLAEGD
jgi:hypothetical protein